MSRTRSRVGAGLEPSAIRDLSIPGVPLRVSLALPPRRVGRVNLAGWWPSFGSGWTAAEARMRARAEMIERASAVFQGNEPRIAARIADLGGAAVHPDTMSLFSARQRRRRKSGASPLTRIPPAFDERSVLAWSPVWSLTGGRWRYVPTMALYFKFPTAPGTRWCPADSNGLAAGQSRPDAALRALLELVERDSVALWWYNRTRRPCLDAGSLSRDAVCGRLLGVHDGLGREAWVLDLTSDLGIPACVAISARRDAKQAPDLGFGFGAGLSSLAAARHALRESAQALSVRARGGRGGRGTGAFEKWRRRASGRSGSFLRPLGVQRPYRSPATARAQSDPETALAWCVERLAARGLEVLHCDLTRPRAGLPVARMIVPGLRHVWPRLAPGRLYQAPVAAGWRRRALSELRLNPVPLLL